MTGTKKGSSQGSNACDRSKGFSRGGKYLSLSRRALEGEHRSVHRDKGIRNEGKKTPFSTSRNRKEINFPRTKSEPGF